MAATDGLTHKPSTEEEFLARCEEDLKDRFTDKDEAFMKVFNAEKSTPPIVESWWVPNNNRWNDRRRNRRGGGPYERPRGRDGGGGGREGGSGGWGRRGYSDYDDRRDSGYRKRPQY